MTPEEIAAKFRNNDGIKTVNYRGRKVDYFAEDNVERYDLYFLVTDPTFDEKCDKEKLHQDFASMKKYLYDEGFLDHFVKDTDPDKRWKIHFLVQYQTTPKTKLDLSDKQKKPTSFLWDLGKTFIIVLLIYSLLKWLLLV